MAENSPPPSLATRLWPLLVLLLATAVVVAAYANSFQVPFTFDDMPNIVHANILRVRSLSPMELFKAVQGGRLVSRPLPNLTFAINFYFGGPAVFGFHLVNLLIHLVVTLCLYWLAVSTLALPVFEGRHQRTGRQIALLAALLWAAHPLQTNGVTYIVQRMTSMSALFYLGALCCYVRGRTAAAPRRRWGWFAAGLVSALLALASKENAAMLPVMVVAYEFYFFSEGTAEQRRRLVAGGLTALLVVAAAALLFLGRDLFSAILDGYRLRNFTMGERLLTEARVIFLYLGLLAWPLPSRLSLNHDMVISRGLFSPPATVFAVLGLVGLVGLAVVLFRRERLASFAIVWFLANLIIESTVVPLELVFEHRLYLPTMFLFLALVATAFRLPRPELRHVARFVLAVAVCGLVFFTRQRNEVWANSVTLWRDVVAKAPELVRGYANLGRAYLRADDYRLAEKTLLAGLAQEGRNRADGRGAAQVSAVAVIHENLGIAYWRLGDLSRASAETDLALLLDPDLSDALITKGILFESQGESARALAMFVRARDLGVDSADLYLNWAVSAFSLGRVDEAIRLLNRAVELEPDNGEAHYNLGIAYGARGQTDEAEREMALGTRLRQQQGGGG